MINEPKYGVKTIKKQYCSLFANTRMPVTMINTDVSIATVTMLVIQYFIIITSWQISDTFQDIGLTSFLTADVTYKSFKIIRNHAVR